MKKSIKIILIIAAIYIVIGCISATRWSLAYDKNGIINSMPNNAFTFVINIFTWPL